MYGKLVGFLITVQNFRQFALEFALDNLRVKELRQEVLSILEQLETRCDKSKDSKMVKQSCNKYEEFNDKINRSLKSVEQKLLRDNELARAYPRCNRRLPQERIYP
jgi:two-component SAPR family response regulator